MRRRELDRALAVGAEWVGTPGGPAGGGVAAWQAAAERLNAIGAAAVERGLGFFHRTGHAGFDFFPDPTPDLAGVRRYQAFLDWTNPRAVSLELDVFSAYVARHRYPPDADGSLFDPVAHVAAQPHRYPLFHLQDAIRVETDDGYTYTDVGDGVLYTDAFAALIDLSVQNGYANFIVARANAPGPSNPHVHDPGRSLRTASRSAQALSGRRAGPDEDSWIDPIPELEHHDDEG